MLALYNNLIPQNSKRISDSEESTNPAVRVTERKAQFTCVISQMSCDQNQIVDHSPDSSALDRAVTNGHIIAFAECSAAHTQNEAYRFRERKLTFTNKVPFRINYEIGSGSIPNFV